MKKDMKEKGAILQRDMQTYAVKIHVPGGFIEPETLRRIADVAERYEVQALKLTSAQRIALIGLAEERVDDVIAELGDCGGAAAGLCVRYVKICPGTRYCKRGQQDSIEAGLEMDRNYYGMAVPWKFKMGVSGCPNDCSEVCIKDLGLVGKPDGWDVLVGGNGGSRPRLAMKLIENVPSREKALAIAARVVAWFQSTERSCRVGKIIGEMGLERFRQEIL